MGKPLDLDIPPGIIKTEAPHALAGRYIDCDKVRFVDGKPQKWKGWETFSDDIEGLVRAMRCWDDNADSRWLAVGTQLGLYMLDAQANLTKITPIAATGTLGTDPFDVTNGETLVTVNHTGHGLLVGTYVTFDGATAVGGITIDGEYQVNTVPTSNSYTIIHSAASNATASGGGASVTYEYEIGPGDANVTQGLGWGTGGWGMGTWGTPRSSSNFTSYPRMWSLDNYGENLLALPSGGYLYQWDPDTASSRAARVANSPFGNYMFVTNERYPVILGADGDNMALAWPDQNDITVWTPGSTVTALVRRLVKGSRLVAGANLVNTNNILWTDKAVYSMTYTGQRNSVYSTVVAGEKCGLIGPKAFFIVGGRAFWMSNFDFFVFGGVVDKIPNADTIKDWLYAQLDGRQNWKAEGHYNSADNEGRWHVILDGDLEASMYVAVSLDDYSWTFGYLDRVCFTEKDGINARTYGADSSGVIYQHEIGDDADGAALDWHLETSPIWIDEGNIVDAQGYIPNFQTQTGDIDVTLSFYDLPQDTTALETFTDTIAEGQGIVDVNAAGRQIAIKLSQSEVGGRFRLGVPKLEVSSGGQRRGGR